MGINRAAFIASALATLAFAALFAFGAFRATETEVAEGAAAARAEAREGLMRAIDGLARDGLPLD